MNAHRVVRRLPEPWLLDEQYLLRELARVRGLILQVPHRNENFGPINTVIDTVWRLEEQIRFLSAMRAAGRESWAKRSPAKAEARKVNVDHWKLKA